MRVRLEKGASFAVAHRQFTEILRGWEIEEGEEESWPMLLGNGGLLRTPHLALRLTSKDEPAITKFVRGIAEDALCFFSSLTSLESVHAELTPAVPKFKYVDPRAKPRRSLYSAVVACLLRKPWNELLETARRSRISGDTEWAEAVAHRLENFEKLGNKL